MVDPELRAELFAQLLHRLVVAGADHVELVDGAVLRRRDDAVHQHRAEPMVAVGGLDHEGGFRHLVANRMERAQLRRDIHLRTDEGAIDHRADTEGRVGIGVQEVVVHRRSEAELAGFGVEPQQVAAEGLGLERPELADPVLLEMALHWLSFRRILNFGPRN